MIAIGGEDAEGRHVPEGGGGRRRGHALAPLARRHESCEVRPGAGAVNTGKRLEGAGGVVPAMGHRSGGPWRLQVTLERRLGSRLVGARGAKGVECGERHDRHRVVGQSHELGAVHRSGHLTRRDDGTASVTMAWPGTNRPLANMKNRPAKVRVAHTGNGPALAIARTITEAIRTM